MDYWTKSDEDCLIKLLWDNDKNYNLPSYLEVKDFLLIQDASDITEVTFDNLIICFNEKNKTFELKLC